jgi:hypothetical protein
MMKKKKILPAIKKDIKHFLLSEEAKMSKKNIAKIGLSLTMLGVMLNTTTATAQHSSSFFNEPSRGAHSSHASHGSHTSHASHGSHGSHTSHASHGAHGSHGSHGQW